MIITITLPTEDFKETYTVEKEVTKSSIKEVNILDFPTITKISKQGDDIYHITDRSITLPDLYYFVNTEEGSYDLVNTCIKYNDLDI